MNNQAAKLVKTTAQLSLKFIQLRISGLTTHRGGGQSNDADPPVWDHPRREGFFSLISADSISLGLPDLGR
jgi:hypothetical protein